MAREKPLDLAVVLNGMTGRADSIIVAASTSQGGQDAVELLARAAGLAAQVGRR
jgi:hypothetical protein